MVSSGVLFAATDAHRRRERSARGYRPLSSRLGLLPVGNKPLVLHALEEMVDVGVGAVAVVTAPSVADEVQEVVAEARGPRVAATRVMSEETMFIDALKEVSDLVGDGPFMVHLGDSLNHGGLGAAIHDAPAADNDVLALVQHSGSQVTPLGVGLTSLPSAGVYVFGPGVLDLATETEAPGDWDLEIAAAADRLARADGRVEVRPVRDWWRYRQRPDVLLQANRFFLSGLRGGPTDAWLENTDLQGPVALHPSARLTSTTVRGPVIIGPGVQITDSYIGPYTSIGDGVSIENAEVEHSIVLPGASIRNLGGRLEASVIGREAKIFRDFRLPRAFRLNVGEGAEVAIS
jgi:glucose-1-phosphate thymidylyltransferase